MPPRAWCAGALAIAVAGWPGHARRAPAPPVGVVVEDHTGTPVAGAVLRVSRPDRKTKTALREIRTDASGRFDLAGLPAADYLVHVEHDNYVPVAARLRADAGAGLSLHLVRYGTVSGRLVPPAMGAVVLIEHAPEGVTPRRQRTQPDALGAFRLWNVPTGRSALAVLNPTVDTRLHRGLVTVPAGPAGDVVVNGGESIDDVQIVLPPAPAASITARAVSSVRDIQGRISMQLLPVRWPAISIVTRLVPVDNVFRIDDVLPGEYELAAAEDIRGIGPEGELRGRARVTVSGADVELDVPMTLYDASRDGNRRDEPDDGAIAASIDRDGAPALAVVVVIDVTPGRRAPVRVAWARPGDDVRFDDLPPGHYFAAARDASAHDARWAPPAGRPPPSAEVLPGVATQVRFTW